MLRSNLIRAIVAHLAANYTGPIHILPAENDLAIIPPCCVVRIGSSEDIGHGQYEMWDLNVMIAVFHDADDTTIAVAEGQASAVFRALDDPEMVIQTLTNLGVVASCWVPITTEASAGDNGWQHIGAYRCIASPTP
jgi:hypothetical protein